MKEFIAYVVGQLVDQPDAIALKEDISGDFHAFVLTIPSSELGKVIGKGGNTIRAIRHLLSAAAARREGRISFELTESIR